LNREIPRILLIGKNGQVGFELHRALSTIGDIVAMDFPEIDLADADSICRAVRESTPRIIVNAAAYTAVEKAESEPEIAKSVNGIAPGILAEEAQKLGAVLIHYSTDSVYNGEKRTPYVESDATAPLSVYGRTKLMGDEAVAAVGGPHLIFRTSWVFGWRGHNFLLTMLRLSREREQLRVVDDQHGAPTWSRLVAEATAQIISQIKPAPWELTGDVSGVYHMTCGGETTWYQFAKAILEADPLRSEQKCKTLVPIPTSEYPTAVVRPARSVLDGTRLRTTFGLRLPDWQFPLTLWRDEGMFYQ
jgi:dTDP-4-dehydrorhamnose reductase